MEHLEFLIEGSQGDQYTVTFEVNGSKAKAFCTCQAGVNGQYLQAPLRHHGRRSIAAAQR